MSYCVWKWRWRLVPSTENTNSSCAWDAEPVCVYLESLVSKKKKVWGIKADKASFFPVRAQTHTNSNHFALSFVSWKKSLSCQPASYSANCSEKTGFVFYSQRKDSVAPLSLIINSRAKTLKQPPLSKVCGLRSEAVWTGPRQVMSWGRLQLVLRNERCWGSFGPALRPVCAKRFIWRAGDGETQRAELCPQGGSRAWWAGGPWGGRSWAGPPGHLWDSLSVLHTE